MVKASKHRTSDVAAHLLALVKMREKSKRIHRKIEEVTARLEAAAGPIRSKTDWPHPQDRRQLVERRSILSDLMDLDDMLGHPDLITRDELRSHLQELIRKFGDPESD